MRRMIALLLSLTLVVLLGAAKCDEQGSGSQPAKPPVPPVAQPQREPLDPNVNNPGPVQGDPSAHDPNPESLELHAVWVSETSATPHIEYSLGAGQIPATNLKANKVKAGALKGKYLGTWFLDVEAKSGVTYGFTMYGTASFQSAECVVIHHGQFHSPQTELRNCASSYTVP